MKRFNYCIISIAVLLLTGNVKTIAQQPVTDTYEQPRAVQFSIYNDLLQYFYQSDKNFTDGMLLRLYHPIFNNKPANFLLLGSKRAEYKDFALALEQDILTPTNLKADSIDTSDRPYAGIMYFDYSRYSFSLQKTFMVESHLFLGIIGKQSLAQETQNGVHRVIKSGLAYGWPHQIGTGLVLDYDVFFRQLIPLGNQFFNTSYFGRAHAGSLFNYAQAGLELKIGHYNFGLSAENLMYNSRNAGKTLLTEADWPNLSKARRQQIPKRLRDESVAKKIQYLNERINRKFQFYFTLQGKLVYTLYDGSIEGSLIPFESSPHTVPSSEVQGSTFIMQYGICFQYGWLKLEYDRFLENDVYNIGQLFGTGEISVFFCF